MVGDGEDFDQIRAGLTAAERLEDVQQVVEVAARRLADAHGATFVRSLVMVPMVGAAPMGAIEVYWARPGQPEVGVVEALQRLADLAVAALQRFPDGIPDPGFKVAALKAASGE